MGKRHKFKFQRDILKPVGRGAKNLGHEVSNVGKFGGKEIDKVISAGTSSITSLAKGISSPFVLIAVAVVAGVVLMKK